MNLVTKLLGGASLLVAVGCSGGGEEWPLGGWGAGGEGPGPSSSSTSGGGGSGGEEIPAVEDPFEAAPAPAPLPQDVVDGLAAEMGSILDGVGGTHSALVVGADTGQVIFERDQDQLLKPASNTKLFTTAAAFATLGEEHRATSRVYATEDPTDGVIDGDLVLVCEHAFTASPFFHPDARWPLDRLADDLARAGLEEVTGLVYVQGEGVWDGYQFAYYDAASHRAALAVQLRDALGDRGIAVGAAATGASFEAPAGATEIGRWASLPLMTTAYPVNVVSHNEFADVLARHVGFRDGGSSSYGAGEAATIDLLASLGVDPTGVALNDGSGLSHDNRVSARQVVGLLTGMLERPEGVAWMRTFAIGGVRGTLSSRLDGDDTWGRFWGKTGTLNGVITLSGVLHHRHDGQRYLVSLLMNGVASNSAARGAHGAVVSALARDHRALGARPEAPVLGCARNDANGATVLVDWSEVDGADAYLVWRSPDGRTWDRAEARLVSKTSHRTVGFSGHERLYLRVSALGDGGESDPSDVYAAMVSGEPSSVVVVDGNDRWQAQPMADNVLDRGHDFVVRAAEALAVPFDTCANEQMADALPRYDGALWLLGNESTADEAFDPDEQARVASFVAGGGTLLVSGAEVAWDLDAEGDGDDRAFLDDVLGAFFVADDAGTSDVYGAGPLAALGRFSFANPGLQRVGYPDVLGTTTGEVLLEYPDGGAAAVERDGVVLLGFPLENVDTRAHRAAILDHVFAP